MIFFCFFLGFFLIIFFLISPNYSIKADYITASIHWIVYAITVGGLSMAMLFYHGANKRYRITKVQSKMDNP
jgi:hypothetical protein